MTTIAIAMLFSMSHLVTSRRLKFEFFCRKVFFYVCERSFLFSNAFSAFFTEGCKAEFGENVFLPAEKHFCPAEKSILPTGHVPEKGTNVLCHERLFLQATTGIQVFQHND